MFNKRFQFIDKATGKIWVEFAPTFDIAKINIFKMLKVNPRTFVTRTKSGDYLIER